MVAGAGAAGFSWSLWPDRPCRSAGPSCRCQKGGTICIGVTNDLARRLPEHRASEGSRFTARYGVHASSGTRRLRHPRRHPAREIAQALATPVEGRADREDQSRMARAVSWAWVVTSGAHHFVIPGRSRSAAPSRRPWAPCREGEECGAGGRMSRLCTAAMSRPRRQFEAFRPDSTPGKGDDESALPISEHMLFLAS
jgi:hypothetical protein